MLKKLAVGIPTYKRPDFTIKLISKILSFKIYDQIIVSSNSKEQQLDDFINSLESKQIIFNQQKKNVGLARNYFDIIKLCECEYLHIISDEDFIYPENLKLLYNKLNQDIDASLILISVNTIDDKVYKDTSWQKNSFLKDSLGETAHIGSSIIKPKNFDDEMFEHLYNYSETKSSVYPTTVAALASYSKDGTLCYFRKPVVKMGAHHDFSEIGNHSTYGFEARLFQYMSLFNFFCKIKIPKKTILALNALYYFAHHALQHAFRKYRENHLKIFLNFYQNYSMNTFYERCAYICLIKAFYFYFLYFGFRSRLSAIIKPYLKIFFK